METCPHAPKARLVRSAAPDQRARSARHARPHDLSNVVHLATSGLSKVVDPGAVEPIVTDTGVGVPVGRGVGTAVVEPIVTDTGVGVPVGRGVGTAVMVAMGGVVIRRGASVAIATDRAVGVR